MKNTWLQFTLNMEKSNKQNLSKFHFHKLKLTCSNDRLYKGTIAYHFHTQTLKFELIAYNRVFQGPKMKKTPTLWCYKWTLLNILGFTFIKLEFSGNPECSYGCPYDIKQHKNALWR